MDRKLSELYAERERLAAYGLHHALALVDAEIERVMHSSDAAPVNRKAPEHATVAPASPGRKTSR